MEPAVTVASTDSFDTVIEPPEAGDVELPAIPHNDDIVNLAPNALGLRPLQLACVHHQFDRLAEDARRLGNKDHNLQPVVTLKDGDETLYFMKMPDGSVLQVVLISSGVVKGLSRQGDTLSLKLTWTTILPPRRSL